jgi:hypothetical protein
MVATESFKLEPAHPTQREIVEKARSKRMHLRSKIFLHYALKGADTGRTESGLSPSPRLHAPSTETDTDKERKGES